MRRTARIALLMTGTLALAGPPTATADTKLRGRSAQFVSAWGGLLAWTEPASRSATNRLVISSGGRVLTIRRPTSAGLISPDVGMAPGGQARVVFGACSLTGRCGLYVLDQGAAHGVALRGTVKRGTIHVAPSQWDGTYVFGRIRSSEPQTGTSRSGGGLFVRRPSGRTTRLTTRVPQSTDLDGTRLAYAHWSSDVRSSQIRLRSLSSDADCRVTRARGNTFLSNPVFDGEYLYWLRRNARTAGGRIERIRLPASGCPTGAPQVGATKLPRAAGGEEGGVDSLAVDGGTVYYSALGIYRADDPPPFTGD